MVARHECFALMAVCSMASQSAAPADSMPPAIRVCAAQTDDSARLQCYDRAVAASSGNVPAAATPITAPPATPAPPKPNATEQFGLSSSQILLKESAGDLPPAQRRLTAHVLKLSSGRSGRLVIRLDNGQVWEQREDGPDQNIVVGCEVTIDRGVLGAYYLSVGAKHSSVKVGRLE